MSNKYTCPIEQCDGNFGSEPALNSHLGKAHDPSEYKDGVNCSYCSETIYPEPWKLENQDNFYCNIECRRSDEGTLETFECFYCGSEFKKYTSQKAGEKIFCPGSQCYHNWQSEKKKGTMTGPNNPIWTGPSETFECEWCDSEFNLRPYQIERRSGKFCSLSCQSEFLSQGGSTNPNWDGGYEPYYGSKYESFRRHIRERDGYECQICWMSNEEHLEEYNMSLHVHHFNKVRYFDDPNNAHTDANAILLCSSCHKNNEGRKKSLIYPEIDI